MVRSLRVATGTFYGGRPKRNADEAQWRGIAYELRGAPEVGKVD